MSDANDEFIKTRLNAPATKAARDAVIDAMSRAILALPADLDNALGVAQGIGFELATALRSADSDRNARLWLRALLSYARASLDVEMEPAAPLDAKIRTLLDELLRVAR